MFYLHLSGFAWEDRTIEAVLIDRDPLPRRRVRTIVVAAPPSVREEQGKYEMKERCGLLCQTHSA